MMRSRRGLSRIEDREEYADMSRQMLGEKEREGIPLRVLAERHGWSITTIHRRIEDARWAIRMEQK